ncbi:MAG: DUF721 domain-containing protein [Burkholderiaceae bacterium]|nr:MAG: DUF721 domain-containing protein [Burkholderiaceae bacterium]
MTPSIGELLQQTQGINALLPTVERHLALQRDVALVLQPWLNQMQQTAPAQVSDLCCVMRLEQDILVLGVRNAALAARLRQILPRLEAGLGQRGWKVSAIRLRVQQEIFVAESSPCAPKTLPKAGLAAFTGLLGKLSSPDLKAAVTRLLKRQR